MNHLPEDLEGQSPDSVPTGETGVQAGAPPHEGAPAGTGVSEEKGASRPAAAKAFWASVTATLMIVIVMMLAGRLDTLARGIIKIFEPVAPADSVTRAAQAPAPSRSNTYTFADLDIHPDVLFRPYTAGPLVQADVSSATARMIHEFRSLLNLFGERQGKDDNFTIRVVDNRKGELLELYEMEAERSKYEALDENGRKRWNWGRIDDMRRVATRNLVQKYADRGIPRPAITVKWGRKNQVLEAREREAPFIEYEVRLARYMGLSLLATEIGTVETFNDDRLVSTVGARSRYQMMPYILRQQGINQYRLTTAAGSGVDVYEEWHPLLTMESAFAIAAGYKNAVGHEIPGISAYHTGPGNLFMVYRMFLTEATELLTPTATVMDAYMWAVTTGYPTVSAKSSFKDYSRGYVASGYGALRATESLPVDMTKTLKAERVQLKAGQEIFLSKLLRVLEDADLNWGPDTEDLSMFGKFRSLNPHIALPAEDPNLPGVSPRSDVRFTAQAMGKTVLFFLPEGGSRALARADVNVLDESQTFRFDESTFARSYSSEMTVWDRQYQEVIRDVSHFGFTNENRRRVYALADKFAELAQTNPTHFRRLQLAIIRTHKGIWQTNGFDRVAEAVSAVRGRVRFGAKPPTELPLSTLDAQRAKQRGSVAILPFSDR